jgi:hypothetical protein
MGDSYQSFVLPEVGTGYAAAVAARLSDWLVARGIAQEGGTTAPQGVTSFSPGPQAEEALMVERPNWRDIAFRDIHIDPHRRVSSAVQGGLGPVLCPACRTPMGDDEAIPSSFTEAADEWLRGGEGMLDCPACHSSTSIANWRTEPFWAFGDVTITFWNWPPIEESFVRQVEAAAGQSVKVVRGKI